MEQLAQDAETAATLTDRGLMLTLCAEVFAIGRAELKSAAGVGDLDRLLAFVNRHSSSDVMIEGHTDNLGSEGYNHGLSQRRADTVKTYLIAHGVAAPRITALGKGGSNPVAGNHTAAGRQRNARIEIIIQTAPA